MKIQDLQEAFQDLQVAHIYREFNIVADSFSKEALLMETSSLLVKHFVGEYCSGFSFKRGSFDGDKLSLSETLCWRFLIFKRAPKTLLLFSQLFYFVQDFDTIIF